MNSKHPYFSPSRKPNTYKPKVLKGTDNYRIGNVLGSGAFSQVYFSQHQPTQIFVALKEVQLSGLDEKHYNCCLKEVELLKRINSINVVKCYEWFFEKSFLYISVELADKTDLEKQIIAMQRKGRLFSERTIWFYFHQICNGIKDMHQARILHRDLKPANIFLNSAGQIKIGDLGLSRLFSVNTQVAKTIISTEYYKAPERTNTGGYHFKSDIWSLGCLLYELCTLRSPFNGEIDNAYALHKKICAAKYLPFPSSIYSDQLQFFVKRCMSVSTCLRPNAEEAHFAARRMFLHFETLIMKHKMANGIPT